MFPLTENGRVASPESRMAGAEMPPIALELVEVEVEETEEVVVVLDMDVELENGATTAAFVASGASTKTVPVTREQADTEALAAKTGAVV